MPYEYTVKTNQGEFDIRLNRPPASREEIMQAIEAKIAQGGGTMKVEPQAEMTPQEFTQARQQAAIQEPAFQSLQRATIPTLAAGASMIPGVGLPAAAAIQAGGTVINQLLGQEPYSTTEIAKSAALPLASQGVVSGVKGGVKAVGKFLNPGATRAAGVQAAVETTGAVPGTVERAFTVPGSRAAYELAERQGPVPLMKINKAITETWDSLTNLSNAPSRAVKYMENLSNKYAGQPQATYADLTNEMQMLRQQALKAFAQKDRPTGMALMEARNKILDTMDEISPAIKEANRLYRREQSTEAIAKVLSNPRPDVKLGELFIDDPLVRGSFSKGEADFLEKIAKQIATMGTQASPYSGVGARFLNLIATPVAAAAHSKTGMYLLRQTFKEGKITPQGLATVAQFMRAYLASGATE